jgi:hypothetical protein
MLEFAGIHLYRSATTTRLAMKARRPSAVIADGLSYKVAED